MIHIYIYAHTNKQTAGFVNYGKARVPQQHPRNLAPKSDRHVQEMASGIPQPPKYPNSRPFRAPVSQIVGPWGARDRLACMLSYFLPRCDPERLFLGALRPQGIHEQQSISWIVGPH